MKPHRKKAWQVGYTHIHMKNHMPKNPQKQNFETQE